MSGHHQSHNTDNSGRENSTTGSNKDTTVKTRKCSVKEVFFTSGVGETIAKG